MRFLGLAVVLLAMAVVNVAAQNSIAGGWRAIVTPGQPRDRMPKTFGEVILDLHVSGTTLTGTATMGDNWPGSAPIHDGKIEGNRFSFKWTGMVPSAGGVPLRYGVPHLTFTGTIDGDEMKLSMAGDYKMELKGKRLP
jgi:hypothetical protein